MDIWEYTTEERRSGFRPNFLFGGHHYDETLIALGVLRFGENLETKFGEGCLRSMQCNVTFGCRLGVYSMTEENHGKP